LHLFDHFPLACLAEFEDELPTTAEGVTPATEFSGQAASTPALQQAARTAKQRRPKRVFLCHAGVPPLKNPVIRLDEIAAVPPFDLFGKACCLLPWRGNLCFGSFPFGTAEGSARDAPWVEEFDANRQHAAARV